MYGLPGNRMIIVSYTLTSDDVLRIGYYAVSDKTTVWNLTNHSYFNLAGEGSGDILAHELKLYSSAYTPVSDDLIPTGEILSVSGTPFDFKKMKAIGRDINADDNQLKIGRGYDHNFVVEDYESGGFLRHAADLVDPASGRKMETWTTLPGMQLYTGNHINEPNGKGGHSYTRHAGVCFETQFFPDSMHHDGFESAVFKGGSAYKSITEYRFGTI